MLTALDILNNHIQSGKLIVMHSAGACFMQEVVNIDERDQYGQWSPIEHPFIVIRASTYEEALANRPVDLAHLEYKECDRVDCSCHYYVVEPAD